MKTVYLTLFFALCLTKIMLGQNPYEIEGRLINKENKEPIPFAKIYNKSLKKGTISNIDGYFRISIGALTDTIRITHIGYKEQFIKLNNNLDFYLINLEENVLLTEEVTVIPKDNSYLFELVQECKKSTSNIEKKSKAYYELKSFINNNQIELVEGYYNVDIIGYKLTDLHLKAGRLALQPYSNRFFASLESSRAIIMFNLLDKNEYFPKNPLELSKSKLKKSYYLTLDNKYTEGVTDSIFVINYKPKDTTGLFFEGKLWINKSKKHIVKITLNCDNALKQPFLPLFHSDKISKVSFNITQSFSTINDQAIFNHTDFIYEIDYISRIGKTEEQTYSVKTNAILYAYDYDDTFFLPIFDFSDNSIGDYRKINAMPYNNFFWALSDEYRLNDSLNSNDVFFLNSSSLTNKSIFKSNQFSKHGLFEHPYIEWSKTRIKFREILPDTSEINSTKNFKSEQYKLSVKIFLDINSYKDSTHFVTSTIFDPYESYYYLPMDNQTHCFVNIYFDLCEIKRQELEKKLYQQKNIMIHAREIYNESLKEFEIKRNEFLKAVQRGTNEVEMLKYNDYVYEKLGINNVELFQPFKNEK